MATLQLMSVQLMELLFNVSSGCGGCGCVDGVSCGIGWCWQWVWWQHWCWLHVFVAVIVVLYQLQVWWQWPCAYCCRSGAADLHPSPLEKFEWVSDLFPPVEGICVSHFRDRAPFIMFFSISFIMDKVLYSLHVHPQFCQCTTSLCHLQ